MNNIYERTIGLLGEEKFKIMQSKTIAVLGIGGVGGTTLLALARTGFISFLIIDFDDVSSSNLNRQILYTSSDINKAKVECATNYLHKINKDINVTAIKAKIDEQNVSSLIGQVDFVVDAIDDIRAKVVVAKYCHENNIPIGVSLGMANKVDPSQITISNVNKTTVDPLGKKYRYLLKQQNIEMNNIKCVYSKEEPKKDGTKLNSIMTVTSTAGLLLADIVIKTIIGD